MSNGADDFYKLSRALKAASRTDLRREVAKGMRDAAKPLIQKTRQAALRDLPQRGGLARSMATAKQVVQVRTGATTAGVQISMPKVQRGITTGQVRHPVFGRKVYVTQRVNGDWWDDTLAEGAPIVVPEITAAMERVARKLLDG